MAMATLCRPTMVPSVASCSNQSTFSSCEPPKACLSLAHSCTAFNKDLSLNTGSHRNGTLQQRVSSYKSRSFRRSGRGAGATSIRAGLPVVSSIPVVGPLANAVLNPVLLFIVYAAGGNHSILWTCRPYYYDCWDSSRLNRTNSIYSIPTLHLSKFWSVRLQMSILGLGWRKLEQYSHELCTGRLRKENIPIQTMMSCDVHTFSIESVLCRLTI